MCVCDMNPVSCFACEWQTNGMVMHIYVCWVVCMYHVFVHVGVGGGVCVCDRGLRRL